MKTKYSAGAVATTFTIGLVAGISPFLFMKLLPVLLQPSLHVGEMSYAAMGVTGLLIGAITAILFGTADETRSSQDIFFYALGIPAILIATVTNLSTEYRAAEKVNTTEVNASNSLMTTPTAEQSKDKPEELKPERGSTSGMIGEAWADDRGTPVRVAAAEGRYVLVIGTYKTQKEVEDAYAHYQSTRLRTETYVQKNLKPAKLGKEFILIYRYFETQEAAQKAYQLIRINDPDIPVRLLKY